MMIKHLEDMTEIELEDWDNRHESVLRWYGTWRNLSIIFLVISIFLVLFMGQVAGAWMFLGFSALALIGQGVCSVKHERVHEEIGE